LTSIFLLGVAACTSPSLRTVPRVVDGDLEHGPLISPYAYEWFIEGEASAAKGQHDEAAMAFENATAAPADDALLMTRLAEEYELSGESRRADRTLSVARRAYPGSVKVALAEGRIEQMRGEYREALSSFARARELAPTWDAPVIAMAELLVAAGHIERASAILREYVGTSLVVRSDHARRALIDLARRTRNAETLEHALALDPHSTPAGRAEAAGKLALEVGQPALAARILAKALDTPENVALWLRALAESGNREEAAAFLARANSQRLGGLSQHVDLLLEIGEVGRALDLLQAAEGSPKAEYATGRALLAQGDYLEAATVLAAVPLGAASFEAARMALADCSMSQGRHGAAAEALSQAPHGSLAVRATLAEIYLEEGALRSGLRLFDPKQDLERATVAALFERAGHFEEAAAYYAAVKVVSSDEPALRARVSVEQLASRGHRRAAIAMLEHWTAVAPDDFYSRVRLIELLIADDRAQAAKKRGVHVLEVIDEPILRAHLLDVLEAPAGSAP
jgi:tetratricopeptide (TPR) repeat protein